MADIFTNLHVNNMFDLNYCANSCRSLFYLFNPFVGRLQIAEAYFLLLMSWFISIGVVVVALNFKPITAQLRNNEICRAWILCRCSSL